MDNIHKLTQNKSFSIYSIPENAEIAVSHKSRNSPSLKDAAYNCGKRENIAESCGNYRAGLEVEVELRDYSGAYTYTILYVAANLRSFRKKTFGWAYSKRELYYDVKLAVDLETSSGWGREFHKKSDTQVVDGTYTHMFVQRWVSSGYHYQYDAHFGAYSLYVSMIGQSCVWKDGYCNPLIFPFGF